VSWGLSGPSGSGKTTLARDLAKTLEAPFLEFKTTELVAELGMSPVAELTLADRFKVQNHLLERFWQISQAAPRPFVSDRTPLDFLTYMLAEVPMVSDIPAELQRRIFEFTDKAVQVADSTYLAIFTVRSLPIYEVNPKRPAPNPAYHRHYEMILEGSLMRLKHAPSYTVFASKHESRMTVILDAVRNEMAALQKQRANSFFC
jgi:hypothetical protein